MMPRSHTHLFRVRGSITMGWGRFLLLGDVGQQLDLRDQQQSLNSMRANIDGQHRRDLRQEQQIQALWEENTELKMITSRLVNLLVAKGVITQEEVQTL